MTTAAGVQDDTKNAADQAAADKAAADKVTADAAAATAKATADAAAKKITDDAAAAKAAADADKAKAPETYTLALPDKSVHLDQNDLVAVEALARAKGWTNEEAQTAITEHHAAIAAQSARFLDEAKADKVYGGAKLEETQLLGNRFLDKYRAKGTPEGDGLRALLTKTGYINHPRVLALFADLGRLTAEDTGAFGADAGGAQRKPEDILYKPRK